ncbi:MAG TPA: DUF4192 domain-containing protein [Dermatophilaceae bacterium]
MTTTIHLSGPADVLAVLPYQLGFHPRDALVAVSLHGTRMGLVQRIDLPPPEHVLDAVTAMIGPLGQDNPLAVLLIGFEEREGESRAMLDEMSRVCSAHGVEVHDRMVVRGGRWYNLDCIQSCCPTEGRELPAPSEVPAVAEFVGRGICPLPDRSALADRVEISSPLLSRAVSTLANELVELRREATDVDESEIGERESELQETESEVHDAESELNACRASELAVWSRVLCDEDDAEPVQALPPQDLAMLAVSLTDVDLRDGLIAWLCPGTLPPELIDPMLFDQMSQALLEPVWLDGDRGDVEQVMALQRIEHRLCELCAALPDEWAVSTLTVLASFTWWRGDGALTRIALDRALRVDPQYRLAQLLERMVDLAIRPERAIA